MMVPFRRRRRRGLASSGIVLLQAGLLLAGSIMVPAPMIAGDPSAAPASESEIQPPAEGTPEPSPTPGSERSIEPASEPSIEPEPEPTAAPEPKPTAAPEPKPTAAPEPKPTAAPEPSSSAEPSPGERSTPSASPEVTTSPPPAGSVSPSSSTDSSPPASSEAPAPVPPAPSPAPAERNRVTVVAAVDIDGNGAVRRSRDARVAARHDPPERSRRARARPNPCRPPASSSPSACSTTRSWSQSQAIQPRSRSISRMARSANEVDTGFWVLQNGRWSDLTARADADHVTDEVTVTLVDGGAGDEDRSADGVIEDPGGPGLPRDDWSLTITVRASPTPPRHSTSSSRNASRRREQRLHAPGPAPLGGSAREYGPPCRARPITPVTLSRRTVVHVGQPRAGRHYRLIQVGTASPPESAPAPPRLGWAVTGFACDSAGGRW